MERVVHIARSFEEADRYDRAQSRQLTANERIKISRRLQRRVFGNNCIDIREWHQKK